MNTFKDLYNFVSSHDANDINEWLKDKWLGKDKQESLLRLFASLKLINKLNNYTICKGNFNKITITPLNSYKNIFYDELNNEIKLKDNGDKSDLHAIIEKDKIILATTSKNLKKENINKFDLRDISDLYQKYYKDNNWILHICLCIKNTEKTKKMILKAKEENNDLKLLLNNKTTIFIDWNDLNEAYINFKSIFNNISVDELININKPLINFKYHQKLAINKTIELKNNNQKHILWGHIQRSGKSYIMAGTIIEDNNYNYLIITTAPNETIEQYLKILDCIQLKEFNIIYLNGNNLKPLIKAKNIIICSKQFLQNKNISWLKKIIFDIRFIDESHNGGTTELAKNILNNYSKDSFTIQITATYSKPSNDFDIPKDNWILWSLEDINLCKNYNIEKLIQKHGYLINNYSKDDIINEYSKYPDLYILTDDIKPEIKKEIINYTKDNNYGYSTEAVLLLKQGITKNGEIKLLSEFQNEEENLKLWYKIFGKYNNVFNIPENENIFINRIKNICKNSIINSRFIYDNNVDNDPYIIMAYLPQNNISKISKATIKLLNKYNVIPYFEIVSINSKTTNNPKQLIEETRIKAKNNNKKGVLVLSGKQCSLGISIKKCDIVILLNNNMSFDMIYQMMFRCMTEEEAKKCGFVIDMNINRVINLSIIDYGFLIKPENHPKETIKYLLEEKLINLNADHWMACFGHNYSKLLSITDNIYNIYSSNTENALQQLLNRLNSKNIILDNNEQKLFNSLFTINSKSKITAEEIITLLDNNEEKIKNGIAKTKIENNNNNDNNKEEIKINYIEILKHLIPLICLLTINYDNTDFIDMFNLIKNNNYIYNILLDQINSWYSSNNNNEIDKNILKIFINIYIKYMKEDKETTNIIRTIKELFTKNINNSKELSKLIDKYLIPEELEKKKNAEVSTPYKLRQEMLDKMPKDFWSKPQKVFEPCSGKGGFLVDIVGRFMEGLKEEIPDDKERYKIIVEECLYWSDINPTNIYIGKLLLDPLEEYNLNYNEGDTLKLSIKEKWSIEGFDAVIGNPPYNAAGNIGTGNTIWQLFTQKSLNEWLIKNGYLLFVHPPGWRKPNSERGKFNGLYKLMCINNQIIYLSIQGIKDGLNIFKCGTRFDWYLIEKNKKYKNTIIKDEKDKMLDLNLSDLEWLPNYNIDVIEKLLAKKNEEKCEIIYNRNNYGADKKWMSKQKNDEFTYTCIHSTPKSGVRYMYSNINTNGHFGISKIIFGDSGIYNAIIDLNGEYGMTQHSMAIKLYNLNEGNEIKQIIQNIKFKDIINSCSWSTYQIDWNIFKYFKKDFYKEFI